MACYDNKKVILTGATGLIGKEAIQPLLDSGFEIYALTIDEKNTDCGVNWINANIFDAENIKRVFESIKPLYLLHFAWVASGDYLISDVNYELRDASLNMLKEFHQNGGKRAVMAGTCFEYEFKDTPLKEDDKLNPQTVYAKCKNELREKAQMYCKENDISFGWGRIFYVYGKNEHEKRLTAHVINSLKNAKEVVINNGDLLKDYMYTKAIAGAFVKFLDTDIDGCVNICTGQGISLKNYTKLIAKKIGRGDLLVIKNESTDQPKIIVGDNSRLLDEVGYNIKYSLDEALEEILRED
ncbi:MAG: NAD(P)-dependent oxidoreductase [bacterium]